MRKSLAVLVFLSICLSPAFSQKRTYLGWEGGMKWDFFEMDDPGGSLSEELYPTFISGYTLGQEIATNLYVETGFVKYQYLEAILFKNMNSPGTLSGMLLYQIPLRIKYSLPVIKNRFFVTPFIGLVGAYNASFGAKGPGGIHLESEYSLTSVKIVANNNYAEYLVFGEAGMALSYRFANNVEYTLKGNYMHGFKTATSADWTYQIDDAPAQIASRSTRASHFSVQAGIQFPLSNFWGENGYIKSVQREYSENFVPSESSRFYLAGKVGLASQNNEAHTGNRIHKPTTLHSHLMAEIAFGYRFQNNWILETGIGSHPLSIGFSIWKDAIKMMVSSHTGGSIDFIGFPLRIKHEFLLSEKMSVSPYLAITQLFSLRTGMVSSGTGSGQNGITGDETYSEIAHFVDRNYGVLLGGGGAFEFKITSALSLLFNAEFNKGFHDMTRLYVEHHEDDQVFIGEVFNKGSGTKISIGLKSSLK